MLIAGGLALAPVSCSQNNARTPVAPGTPVIRVLLVENAQRVEIAATASPTVHAGPGSAEQQLRFAAGVPAQVSLDATGWQIGNARLPRGELTITPSSDGSVSIAKHFYHGRYRFIPVGPDRFDVVNDVDVESYLRGVLRQELLPDWAAETYKAQAIVARTYALYEAHTEGVGRQFDVYDDQRSQVYGGIDAESPRSRDGTFETAGIVVAYGPVGRETIFKAYFSSCCGGIGQSVTDGFGESELAPLRAQRRGNLCAQSTKFNWGPIVIPKAEITRRVKAWGAARKQPLKDIGPVTRIDVQAANEFGRPVRFIIADTGGKRFLLRGEQMREAVNTDATAANAPKIFSSFCKPVDEGANIRFADGHGYGHGVGMCQWCAQAQALKGWNDEAIVLGAYPGAKLVRAY
jgi:stage II sporulation protein D